MSSSSGRRVLNRMDRAVLVTDRFLSSIGHPGMQCQVQVWFADRISESRLRRAVQGIVEAHPVVTGRLVPTSRLADAHWRFPVEGPEPLRVEELEDDDDRAVQARAASAFAPIDLEVEPPLRLSLLRRPSQGDVLLLHFSHVLMDGKAPELLLAEMGGIDRGEPAPSPAPGGSDELTDWYRDHSLGRRLRAGLRHAVRNYRVARPGRAGHPVRMAMPEAPRWGRGEVRIRGRSPGPELSSRIRRRARETVGFEHLIPVLLASLWRAVDRTCAWDRRPEAPFRAVLPISLRPSATRPVPPVCNLSSYVGVSATRPELADRAELCQTIASRFRDRLRDGAEIGGVQSLRWLGRRDDRIRRAVVDRGWRLSTMAFAYHGRDSRLSGEMFGSRVERFYNLVPAMSVPTLSVTDLNGLHLGLTYTPDLLTDEVADELLDAFVDDLSG
ncbi:MAG: hypothetical protein R3326_07660 [Gemmatimonadota bacterium]|nr:hypothetical protein [Gemmatimonadota bacterium]